MGKALVAHRADQQPTQPDVISRPDDQKVGVLGLTSKHWAGITGEALPDVPTMLGSIGSRTARPTTTFMQCSLQDQQVYSDHRPDRRRGLMAMTEEVSGLDLPHPAAPSDCVASSRRKPRPEIRAMVAAIPNPAPAYASTST